MNENILSRARQEEKAPMGFYEVTTGLRDHRLRRLIENETLWDTDVATCEIHPGKRFMLSAATRKYCL